MKEMMFLNIKDEELVGLYKVVIEDHSIKDE